MAEKDIKSCANCKHNDKNICNYVRDNFLTLTRVLDRNGQDVGQNYTLSSAITITDEGAKVFCCNQWKLKEKEGIN